jgi:hypothetical protein
LLVILVVRTMKFFFIEQDNNPKESFVPGGRRVVDIGHLLSALKNINHKIYGCAFSNIDIINEKHLGLKSIFKYRVSPKKKTSP